MTGDIRARFGKLGNFPSPPAIAQEIIALAKNPDASVAQVATAISKDPALVAKVLRIANSSLYAQRRQCQNVRQALTIMGVDAVMTLCLGFSITSSLKASKAGCLDYPRYWRRSLLAALSARCVAECVGMDSAEDVFLAGLLQDLGVPALDRAAPGFYKDLPAGASHAERSAYERERLGEDHAALGAWLLETWQLPGDLVEACRNSHDPLRLERASEQGRLVRCVALGTDLASACLDPARRAALAESYVRGADWLGLDAVQMSEIVTRISALSHDLGQSFDTKLMGADEALSLVEEAQELLAERSVESLAEIDALKARAHELVAQSAVLSDAGRRDSLTGIYNRGHFDASFSSEFAAAASAGHDLALLFIDLDHFKRINDTHGHQAGDAVLQSTASLLSRTVRAQDLVARYGGEEFVVLLPGQGMREAVALATRMLATLRTHTHPLDGQQVVVTASMGLAVHGKAAPFPEPAALLAAADAAAYQAKRAGRDRLCAHGAIQMAPLSRTA